MKNPTGEAVLDVVNDLEYRKVLNAALQEIRDNTAKAGRNEALVDCASMNYLLATMRPDIISTVATIVMFELAELTAPAGEATPASPSQE